MIGLLVALFASVAVAGPGDGPEAVGRTVPIDSNAPIRMAQSDRRSGDTAAPRLHGSLARLQAAHARREADLPAASGVPAELIEDGRVLVEIRTRSGSRTAADLGVLGGEIRHRLGDSAIEAWMPIEQLDELTALAEVVRVWPARMPEFLEGSVTSQGVAAGQAGPWHTAGLDGDGVTIAIIDGFHRSEVTTLQGSGDWPLSDQLTKKKMGSGIFGDNNQPHGNAVLEIAYDLAPGADYIAYDTVFISDWIDAINDAVSRGADIISASLGAPLDGIGDGSALDGSVAEAVEAAEAAGAIYINAAGNSREEHWGGLYDGSGVAPWDDQDYQDSHVWANGDTLNPGAFCYPDEYPAFVTLSWSDWDSVDHDYDLFLLQYDADESIWQVVGVSDDLQDGSFGQRPQEWVQWEVQNSTGGLGCPSDTSPLAVMVARWDAPTDQNLRLFTNLGELHHPVSGRSLGYPADSPSAVTVAALDVSNSNHEPYSAEGPILAPGGGLPTGSEHPKPDVASFARVDVATDLPNSEVFAGTSAAAPHVAGMAALLKQRHPGMTRAELVDRLQQISGTGSNDLGVSGHDFRHGYGRLRFQLEDALVVTDQPADADVDKSISDVVVELRDDEGELVRSGPTETIDAAIGNDPSGGSASLAGTASRSLSDGVALFDDLSIDTGGEGYTLSLVSAAPGPVESNEFDIFDREPAALVFDVQPSDTPRDHAVDPAIVVQVLDGNGDVLTDDNSTEVVLSIVAGPGSATLSGGGPLTVTNGEAVFGSVSIDTTAAGYQLEAADTGGALEVDSSVSFDILAGDPASLSFAVEPGDSATGKPIDPAVAVEILDDEGNRVTWDDSTEVTLTRSGGSGGNLSGGGPLTASNGLVVFDSAIIDLAGSDYRLHADDGSLETIDSAFFDVIDDDLFFDRFEEP